MHKTITLGTLAAALLLGGCASVYQLQAEVSSYGQWPAARAPAATYAFERLPSQQSDPERQQALEDAARPAIEAAGFRAAASPASADVSVQLGANVTPVAPLYADPFFWGGSLRYHRGYWHRGFPGPFYGTGFGMNYSVQRYEREVTLLIRDRSSGAALYEAHARNDGYYGSLGEVAPAMFQAALKDFPNGGVNPRRVSIELPVVR